MKKWVLVIVAVFLMLGVGVLPEGEAAESISVKPINGLQSDFIKGADISMLAEVEKSGGRYFDQNGKQVDPIKHLKDKGVNYVRVRLWHNPYDSQGRAYNGGTNDLNTAIGLSKRAKAQNMKVLLDFHYSDFWTDPGKQFKPKAWASLSQSDLEKAVSNYTSDVLKAMKAQNALPNMVQIGNELNSGMLWPNGKSWGKVEASLTVSLLCSKLAQMPFALSIRISKSCFTLPKEETTGLLAGGLTKSQNEASRSIRSVYLIIHIGTVDLVAFPPI